MQALNKTVLSRVVKLLMSCFVLAFLYVLFRMATWTPAFDLANEISEVTVGETKLVSLKGKRFWVTRFSQEQKQQMDKLKGLVHQDTVCSESEFCLVKIDTSRLGVIIRYTIDKPAQLVTPNPWFGGFVNPANGAVYDLKGRGYVTNSLGVPMTISTEIN